MTHPKPDNAPIPTGPVARDFMNPSYSHGDIRRIIAEAIQTERDIAQSLRALLAQRDKRVEELDKDGERLDWLNKQSIRTGVYPDKPACIHFSIGVFIVETAETKPGWAGSPALNLRATLFVRADTPRKPTAAKRLAISLTAASVDAMTFMQSTK